MMNIFFDFLKNTKLLIATILGLIIATISGYQGYLDIKNDIAGNTKHSELFQKQMLSPMVRYAEKNPCVVSDSEWEDYEINYNTLFNLKVKYDKVPLQSYNMQRRLEEDKSECTK